MKKKKKRKKENLVLMLFNLRVQKKNEIILDTYVNKTLFNKHLKIKMVS